MSARDPGPIARVLLNDRVLLRRPTGVGHYTRELLDALRAEHVEVHAVVSDRLPMRRPPRETARPSSAEGSIRVGRAERLLGAVRPLLEGAYRLAFRASARRCDLYHEPNHIPIACDLPTVTTIHDLSVLLHPEWHPESRVRWYERHFARGLRQTRRFLATSEHTRQEMVRHLGLSPSQIDVTHPAPRREFEPQPAAAIHALRRRLGLPERFFLYAGSLEPRKNLEGALEAFAALPSALRREHPLVLAGGGGWRMETLPETISRLAIGPQIRRLGYVSDSVLAGLYSGCTALVWPSLYEGFGLPPLEAMACGAPVIASRASSLPEVVADAGVLLDPRDVPAWSDAMRRMAEDEAWRAQWRERGPARAAAFSWPRCARQTIECYRAARA
ncbi:MAG TPA: glycosyltransferase family 1 protein [Myxococcota bacterium]|nr:glycosyltransferase family 1 protein [Myxococcota bacterium]